MQPFPFIPTDYVVPRTYYSVALRRGQRERERDREKKMTGEKARKGLEGNGRWSIGVTN